MAASMTRRGHGLLHRGAQVLGPQPWRVHVARGRDDQPTRSSAQVIAARRAADRGRPRRRARAQQAQVQLAAGMQRECVPRRLQPRQHGIGQHVAGMQCDRQPRAACKLPTRRDQRLIALQCRHRSPVPLLRYGARQMTLARAPVEALVPAVAHRTGEGLDLRPLAPRHVTLELARPWPQGVARHGAHPGERPPALNGQPARQPVTASARIGVQRLGRRQRQRAQRRREPGMRRFPRQHRLAKRDRAPQCLVSVQFGGDCSQARRQRIVTEHAVT